MELSALVKLNAARARRDAAVTLTDLATGRVEVVLESEARDNPLAAEIGQVLRSGKASTLDTPEGGIFINAYLPAPRIVVIGAVHISQALARLAPVVGYDVTVIDPRGAFATQERFGDVRLLAEWPEDVLQTHPLDNYTALATVTHDPKIDDVPLVEALKAGCFYVGALGSRKTHAKRIERLKALGCSDRNLERIAAPIGLNIGAASPAEIALATLAQIVQAFRQRHLQNPDDQ